MKVEHVFIAALCLALSGCLATVPSQPAEDFDVVQLDDQNMSCEQLRAEVERLDGVLKQTGDPSANAMSNGATQAALHGGVQAAAAAGGGRALGGLPVVGSLLSIGQGAQAMSQAKSAQMSAKARARKQHLVGLYQRKQCKA